MKTITRENFLKIRKSTDAISGIQRYAKANTQPDPFKAVESYEALLAYADQTGDRDEFISVSRDLASCFTFLNGSYFCRHAIAVLDRLFEKYPESVYADLPEDVKWIYAVCLDLYIVNILNNVDSDYGALDAALTHAEGFWKKYGHWEKFKASQNEKYTMLGTHYEYGFSVPMPKAFSEKLHKLTPDNLRAEYSETMRGGEVMKYLSGLMISYAAGNIRQDEYFDALEKTARHVMALNIDSDENYAVMHHLQAAVISCAVLGKHAQVRWPLGVDLFAWISTLPPKFLGIIHTLDGAFYEAAKMAGLTKSKHSYVHTLLKTTTQLHIPTYAHSLMVGELMAVIARYLMEKDPAAFYEMFGTEDKAHILSEVRIAGEGHDIGKIAYINTISQMGRKLTGYELELLKLHPELAAKFYQDEDYKCIYDVAYGHHKTYCGKGGYPAVFDNTASPFRLVIDIASVADAIDAATDYIGRQYKKTKTTDAIISDIVAHSKPDRQEEIRYNPMIAEELRKSDALRNLIGDTVENYRHTAYARAYAAFAPCNEN